MANPVPFAHLLGLGKKAKRAEDEEPKKDAETGEDETDDKEDDEKSKKAKKAKRADDSGDEGDDAAGAESDLDGDDLDEDNDEDAEDEKETPKTRKAKQAGARQERARCAAIVAAGIKANQVHTACALAFDTTMSAASAINVLKMSRQDNRGPSLNDRMTAITTPNPGTASGQTGSISTFANITATAMQKVRG